MHFKLFNTLIFSILIVLGQAQSYPKNYFRSPVDGKIALAGTFGELRSYHFHTGIDIKAGEGTPIKAAADGYLFRIKISESGYGYVMYVNHPNGYTTVYAHLSRFTDTLNKFMYGQQYKVESEELDLSLPDSAFCFKKGEIIGYSGNTGHSAGPHLHFEIRDTKTEEAINPLLFGIKVKDDVKPTIQGIKIYPMTETANVEGKNNAKFYSLKTKSGYKKQLTIKAFGDIAFAFQAHDYTTESSSRCGIYEIQLHNEKQKVFGQRISRVAFEVSRYINTYKDYDEFHDNSRHLHKAFIRGNNKLQFYTEQNKNGILNISGSDTLMFFVKAFDVAGNKDSVCITVIPNKITLKAQPKKECKQPLEWAKDFTYKSQDFEVNIPAGSLYNDACFHYYSKKRNPKAYSASHVFYANGEPVQESFDLFMAADTTIDSLLKPKIFIGRTTDFKSITAYQTALINNGMFAAQVRTFGTFCLMADTVAPTIKLVGFKDSMVVSKTYAKEIAFEIKDELAGLKTAKLFVNDKWVLTHYHLKKDKMIVLLKEINLPPGLYPIRVEAIDKKDNKSEFKAFIQWQ